MSFEISFVGPPQNSSKKNILTFKSRPISKKQRRIEVSFQRVSYGEAGSSSSLGVAGLLINKLGNGNGLPLITKLVPIYGGRMSKGPVSNLEVQWDSTGKPTGVSIESPIPITKTSKRNKHPYFTVDRAIRETGVLPESSKDGEDYIIPMLASVFLPPLGHLKSLREAEDILLSDVSSIQGVRFTELLKCLKDAGCTGYNSFSQD